MEEYEFKIGLLKEEDRAHGGLAAPPKVELIRQHLQAVLGVVAVTKDGEDATIDGFRFLGEDKIYSLTSD
jgi:hypothetical protein